MVPSATSFNSDRHRHRPVSQLVRTQVLQTQLDKDWERKEEGSDGHAGVNQGTATDMPLAKPVLPIHQQENGKDHRSIPLLWCLALAFMVFVYGSYGVLMNLSKVDHQIPFSSSALNFLVETTKFAVAATLLTLDTWQGRAVWSLPSPRQALPFAVPAVLYSVNNNLAVFMQVHMDPATYQVLGNLKIVTTAVLYRLILKSLGNMVGKGDVDLRHQYITLTGLLAILTYCLISALAGVYTEFILKKDPHTSLHLQNMMLYTFSISLNLAGWFVSQSRTALAERGTAFQLFEGFSFYTWLVILTQALNGLGMSVVFKHGSNLVRLFVISCAMVVSTTLSILVLGVSLNILYFVTLFLVIVAIYLYYH
ncbi:putative UDP-sugar transporter protein SLC35A4 isoform X2 [Babylonia areolata]|uniref:putative UDP-sugar transporter protein SLC35A4 isoform X2 n=1 Tax=Babylonia areolata TaxID=304850 RepID=UPI003FD66D60